MGLIDRIKARLGYDTTVEKTYVRAVYQYEILHLNGEVSEPIGHIHRRDEGFVLVEEADDDTWHRATAMKNSLPAGKPWRGSQGFDLVRELEGVQEVNRDLIGTDVWTITVDYAGNSIENVERERHEGVAPKEVDD